jgi:hypothetical protein
MEFFAIARSVVIGARDNDAASARVSTREESIIQSRGKITFDRAASATTSAVQNRAEP